VQQEPVTLPACVTGAVKLWQRALAARILSL